MRARIHSCTQRCCLQVRFSRAIALVRHLPLPEVEWQLLNSSPRRPPRPMRWPQPSCFCGEQPEARTTRMLDVRKLPAIPPPPPQKRPPFTTCKTSCMRRNESGRRNRNMSRIGVVFGGSRTFRPWVQPGLKYRGAGAQRWDGYEPPAAPCGFLLLSRSTLFPYSWRLDSSNHVLDDVDIFMYPVSMLLLPQVILPSTLLALYH